MAGVLRSDIESARRRARGDRGRLARHRQPDRGETGAAAGHRLRDDILEIALEGLDHLIHKPSELYVDEGGDGLLSLEVFDREGDRQIVKLLDPLMLPAPSAARR